MSSKQTRKENADKGELRRQSSKDIKKKTKTLLWKELIAGQTGWLQGHTVLVQKGLEGEGGSRAGLLSLGRNGGHSHWRSWMLWVFPGHCPSQKRQGGAGIEQSWLMGGTQGTGDLWHHDSPSGSGSRSLS